jgi:NitT/TauT family transport system substrate-binding protein
MRIPLIQTLRTSLRASALAFACAGMLIAAPTAQAAEKATVVLQYGISYLPLSVMQAQKLWEVRAKHAGVDLDVEWKNLGNGGALNDAILTGSADLAAGGLAPMMKLWDRTRGNVKVRGIAALGSLPVFLVTNKPHIKTLKDFKPEDKIALSIPKVSYQAVILQMAADKAFAGEYAKLDAQTVSMKHPDAVAALASSQSTISAYFGSAPYQEDLLKRPGIHKVTDSFEVFGGPLTFTAVWSASSFVQKRPVVYKAFLAALGDALDRIKADKAAAVDDYLKVTNGDAKERELLISIVKDPQNIYTSVPQKTEKFSEFLARTGFLDAKPASWKDYFFEGLEAAGAD